MSYQWALALTLTCSVSWANNKLDLFRDSDERKAQLLILHEAGYRMLNNDRFAGQDNLGYKLTKFFTWAPSAKNSKAMKRLFDQAMAEDRIEPVLGRDRTVWLIKQGLKHYKGAWLNPVVDKVNEYLAQLEKSGGKVVLYDVPSYVTPAFILGVESQLKPELRESFGRLLASTMGTDYDQKVIAVGQERIMDQEMTSLVNRELGAMKDSLSEVHSLLEEQKNEAERARVQEKIEWDAARGEAAITLAAIALEPLMGPVDAAKFRGVGQELVNLHKAFRTFGPTGVTPDKLLMATNFATAGVAVVGILSSQGKDPTMEAMKAIMEQLVAIQKQLERIENKIDHLTDLVLAGFKDVLDGVQTLDQRIKDVNTFMVKTVSDTYQYKALETYLNFLRSHVDHYQDLQECNSEYRRTSEDGQNCYEKYSRFFATRTIGTLMDEPTTPKILSDIWTNQLLTHRQIHPDQDHQLVLAELSKPLYFAENQPVFRSFIARNHEAVSAYLDQTLQEPRFRLIPNPELLTAYARSYLNASGLHSVLRSRRSADLTDHVLERIEELNGFIRKLDSPATWQSLITLMKDDLKAYNQAATQVIKELSSPSNPRFTVLKQTLNTTPLKHCDKQMADLTMPSPVNSVTLADKVPGIFWLIQELGLGKVGACYRAMSAGYIITIGAQHKITFVIELFLNPTHQSPGVISDPTPAVYTPSVSQTIAALSYTTPERFSTQDSYFRDTVKNAWYFGDPWHVHDCFEQKGRSRAFINNCMKVKGIRRTIEVFLERASYSRNASTTDLVNRVLMAHFKPFAEGESQVWNFSTLSFGQRSSSPIQDALARMANSRSSLATTMKRYNQKYLLMQGMLLTGLWHQNPVSSCLSELTRFSPAAIASHSGLEGLGHSAEYSFDFESEKPSIDYSEDFEARMTSMIDSCRAKSMHPDLVELKKKLANLLKHQLAN